MRENTKCPKDPTQTPADTHKARDKSSPGWFRV